MLSLVQLVQGKFNIAQLLKIGSIKFPFQYDLQCSIQKGNPSQPLFLSLFFQVFPKKYPVMNQKHEPDSFSFIHKIIFVTILNENINLNKNTFRRTDLQVFENYLRIQQQQRDFFEDMKLVKESNDQIIKVNQGRDLIGNNVLFFRTLIVPRTFKSITCKDNKQVYNHSLNKWMTRESEKQYLNKIEQINFIQQDHYLIKKYCNMPSSNQLLKIIEKIQNFQVNLTQEQAEVIAHNGDALVIGRSGTGQTICALLRLFSTDILFKLRMKLDQIKYSTQDIQLNQQDQNCQLKTLFVTASPLLACQVKRKYDRLVQNIQDSINKKRSQTNINSNQSGQQSSNVEINFEQSTFEVIEALKQNEKGQNEEYLIQNEEMEEEEIDQYEKEMGRFKKFSEVTQYPIFLTLRKILMLLDSSLINSFFSSYGPQHKSAQWQNEQCVILMLDQHKIDLKIVDQSGAKLMNQIDTQDYIVTNIQEVTLEVFENVFWPKIKKQMSLRNYNVSVLDPTIVWAEICSKIKGHETSHEYPDKCMNYENYSYYHKILSDTNSRLLYQSFEIYENMKQGLGYYDLLDIVNHINYELTSGSDAIETVHYFILDELQDVPMAVVILFDKLTSLGLFCCGDNAQNIAKGVGYKFSEAQNCLLNYRNTKKQRNTNIKLFDLNVNFRQHNQILQLGNSVIRILELCFHYEIERLKKEISDLQGPKPVIIQSEETETLLNSRILSQREKFNRIWMQLSYPSEGLGFENKITILTIYEAKGLEFEDVILYNFFNDSSSSTEAWGIFRDFKIKKLTLSQADYQRYATYYSKVAILNPINDKKFIELKTLERDFTRNRKKRKNNKGTDIESLSLSQELKQLYVAITRAKKRLIIFDQYLQKRYFIQRMWSELEVIEVIQKQSIPVSDKQFVLDFGLNNQGNWKRQGQKMFRLNNYDQAAKCFKFAGEAEISAQAYHLAIQSSYSAENTSLFLEAARLFVQINLPNRAAQCYFSAQSYEQSLQLYTELGFKQEMAESAYLLGQFEQAGQLFQELGDIRRSVDSYNKSGNWNSLIQSLNLHKEYFTFNERMAFLNKYLPSFLQKMTEEIEFQDKQLDIQEQSKFLENQEEEQSFCIQNSITNFNEIIAGQQQLKGNQDEPNQIFQLNDSESFQIEDNVDLDKSIDHLTFYDPDDEWLKQNQKSLIKSMTSSCKSMQSDISNVLLMNEPFSVSLLKSKTNIFIQNNVLQQLIQRFLPFSEELKAHLDQQKSKAMQLSNRKEDDKEFDHLINFLYDVDNIGIDTIYLILDLLEQFKSYKLCIYVCNQFKLSNYLGRYLVSLASKYSPFTKKSIFLNAQIVGNSQQRKNLLDQSILAQLAVKNIIESINPQFLQFKFEEILHTSNSLAFSCYQELIALGYWKIIIYQLDYQNALDLSRSFCSSVDIVNIIQKVKENRSIKGLSQSEEFELVKHQYYQHINQWRIIIQDKKNNGPIFPRLFELSNLYFNNNELNKEEMIILIKNAKIYTKSLSNSESLNLIESIILSFFILRSSNIRDLSNEQLIELFQIQLYSHNKLISFQMNSEAIEALFFCYKCSFPSGRIMSDYCQYSLVHITSILMKFLLNCSSTMSTKDNSFMFLDIGYEYVLVPVHILIKQIQNQFTHQIQLWLKQRSLGLREYYEIFTQEETFLNNYYDCQDEILAEILVLTMIENEQRNLLNHHFPRTKENFDPQIFPAEYKYDGELELFQSSILQSVTSSLMKEIHRILLKNNLRIKNMPSNIKAFLRYESIKLFQQAKRKAEIRHSNLILAINLLNLSNELSYAVFSIQSYSMLFMIEPYMKYIEFLECQYYNIIEDSIGCILELNAQIGDICCQDEIIHHLIRIGIQLMISLPGHNQLLIPKKYLEYLQNTSFVDKNSEKFEAPVYELQNIDIFNEYLRMLNQFLKTCNYEFNQQQANVLLVTFIINIKTFVPPILNTLIQITLNDNRFKFYEKIPNLIKTNLQTRRKIFIEQQYTLVIESYVEERLCTLHIKNNQSVKQLDILYDQCLNSWNEYQEESSNYRKNGFNNIPIKITETRYFFNSQRFCQFFQFTYSNLYRLLISKGEFHQQLKFAFALQQDLAKQRYSCFSALGFHYISSLLNITQGYLIKIGQGENVVNDLWRISNQLKTWIQNDNQEQKEMELLARNRDILLTKWQNLKAGVKIRKQVKSKRQPLSVILEDIKKEQ